MGDLSEWISHLHNPYVLTVISFVIALLMGVLSLFIKMSKKNKSYDKRLSRCAAYATIISTVATMFMLYYAINETGEKEVINQNENKKEINIQNPHRNEVKGKLDVTYSNEAKPAKTITEQTKGQESTGSEVNIQSPHRNKVGGDAIIRYDNNGKK